MQVLAITQRNIRIGLDRVIRIRLEPAHVQSLRDLIGVDADHSRLRASFEAAIDAPEDRNGLVPLNVTVAECEFLLEIAADVYKTMAQEYVGGSRNYYAQQLAEKVGRAIGVKMMLDFVGRNAAPNTGGYLIDVAVDDHWIPDFVA
jgi:hypothetical protein